MWLISRKKYLHLSRENEALRQEIERMRTDRDAVVSAAEACRAEGQRFETLSRRRAELGRLWSNTADNVTVIREKSAEFAGKCYESRAGLAETADLFEKSSEMLVALAESLVEIQANGRHSAESIESVNQVVGSVHKFVGLIESISEQTNLLALNAAIEAARAGEYGRGFAVVAEEVRNLARRTGEATREISTLVRTINVQTEQATGRIQAVADNTRDTSRFTEVLRETVDEVVTLSRSMQGVIEFTSHASFINTVKMDHIVWKNEVYKIFNGLSDKAPTDFVSHRECRLGQWYFEGDGRRCYSALASYLNLDEPHRLVHEAGVAAIEAMARDDWDTALESLSRMEEASNRVLDCLDLLGEEIGEVQRSSAAPAAGGASS